jgi:hypothetical protein
MIDVTQKQSLADEKIDTLKRDLTEKSSRLEKVELEWSTLQIHH